MFTGIIEEIGVVKSVQTMSGGRRLRIEAPGSPGKIGSSISVDGVCQTVVRHDRRCFTVECLEVSLQKTTLGNLREHSHVNLERALPANGRLDGHIVQGHVNGRGKIENIEQRGDNRYISISLASSLAPQLMSACIPEGSIAVNGVSLTIAEMRKESILINIIPHTWEHTTFRFSQVDDDVNVETDIFARYIEHFFNVRRKHT
ncbi:MAG: riboflavin synthase [Salinispira sp.]